MTDVPKPPRRAIVDTPSDYADWWDRPGIAYVDDPGVVPIPREEFEKRQQDAQAKAEQREGQPAPPAVAGASDEPTVRRVDGPTPNGGAYMVIGEYTENGVRRVEITEFDEKDRPIFRTYGTAS
jgi:hypothetical protein